MSFLPSAPAKPPPLGVCVCITWDLSLLAAEAMFAEGRAQTLQPTVPPLSPVPWAGLGCHISHFSQHGMHCSTSCVRRQHTRVETRCSERGELWPVLSWVHLAVQFLRCGLLPPLNLYRGELNSDPSTCEWEASALHS